MFMRFKTLQNLVGVAPAKSIEADKSKLLAGMSLMKGLQFQIINCKQALHGMVKVRRVPVVLLVVVLSKDPQD